jgi:hypothetical protein
LHLGRWHYVRMGSEEGGLIAARRFPTWFTGPAMSRWDGDRDGLVESAGGGLSALRSAR